MQYTVHAQARSVRRRVLDICAALLDSKQETDAEKRYWVLATLREAAFGLGDEPKADQWAAWARQENPPTWMMESTDAQIEKLRRLLATIAAKPKA